MVGGTLRHQTDFWSLHGLHQNLKKKGLYLQNTPQSIPMAFLSFPSLSAGYINPPSRLSILLFNISHLPNPLPKKLDIIACLRETLSSRNEFQNQSQMHTWPVRAVRVDKIRLPSWIWSERPKELSRTLWRDTAANDQKAHLHCTWSAGSFAVLTCPSIWKSETRSLWKRISNASIVHLLLNGIIRTSMFWKQPPTFTP